MESIWHRLPGRASVSGWPRLLFGQMREDGETELKVLRRSRPDAEVFCIASAGCTAFTLLLAQPGRVDAVDLNPAQIGLCQMKQALWPQLTSEERKKVWDRGMEEIESFAWPTIGQDLGSADRALFKRGLLHAGLIDRRMELCAKFYRAWPGRDDALSALEKAAPAERHDVYDASFHPQGNAFFFQYLLASALRLGLGTLPPGAGKTLNERFRHFCTAHAPAENPYWQQTMRGSYGDAWPCYFLPVCGDLITTHLPCVRFATADAAVWLRTEASRCYDFFALSNILDFLPETAVNHLLESIHFRARAGACLVMRSLFPPTPQLTLVRLGWKQDEAWSARLEADDRCGFCRGISVWQRH